MKFLPFLLLFLFVVDSFEVYSQTDCYTTYRTNSINAFEKGQYNEALQQINQISLCAEIPVSNDISNWTKKIKNCINWKNSADTYYNEQNWASANEFYSKVAESNPDDEFCLKRVSETKLRLEAQNCMQLYDWDCAIEKLNILLISFNISDSNINQQLLEAKLKKEADSVFLAGNFFLTEKILKQIISNFPADSFTNNLFFKVNELIKVAYSDSLQVAYSFFKNAEFDKCIQKLANIDSLSGIRYDTLLLKAESCKIIFDKIQKLNTELTQIYPITIEKATERKKLLEELVLLNNRLFELNQFVIAAKENSEIYEKAVYWAKEWISVLTKNEKRTYTDFSEIDELPKEYLPWCEKAKESVENDYFFDISYSLSFSWLASKTVNPQLGVSSSIIFDNIFLKIPIGYSYYFRNSAVDINETIYASKAFDFFFGLQLPVLNWLSPQRRYKAFGYNLFIEYHYFKYFTDFKINSTINEKKIITSNFNYGANVSYSLKKMVYYSEIHIFKLLNENDFNIQPLFLFNIGAIVNF